MKARKASVASRILMVTAVGLSAVFVTASPAAAADDTFTVATGGQCPTDPSPWAGLASFIDFGPGAPGGGDNDDYVEIADICPNGVGVKAWAWVDGVLKGSQYNGNGDGSIVVWDPFGNVTGGHAVGLKVCSVNGTNGTPFDCTSATRTIDG